MSRHEIYIPDTGPVIFFHTALSGRFIELLIKKQERIHKDWDIFVAKKRVNKDILNSEEGLYFQKKGFN